MRLLDIEECVYWIFNELIFKDGVFYKYSQAQKWEFLIFTATNYLLNTKKLQKLERLTGMVLLQIETNGGTSKIWFGRLAESPCIRSNAIADSAQGRDEKRRPEVG